MITQQKMATAQPKLQELLKNTQPFLNTVSCFKVCFAHLICIGDQLIKTVSLQTNTETFFHRHQSPIGIKIPEF